MRPARRQARHDAFQPHQAHQPLHALAIDLVALLFEPPRELAAAVERVTRVFLVEEPHQLEVLGRRRRRRLVVHRRAMKPEKPALPTHR
jgi:hypothetical protein